MTVIVQYVVALFAHLSFTCVFYVIRPLFCFNTFMFLLFFYFVLFYTFYFLFCVFCDLCCFTLCIYLFLPFVYKCKDHCHKTETQLQ
jgi:hypothetical protein